MNNLPYALTPDTTDPHTASMDYEDPEFLDFDAEMESKIPENDWKLVGGKPKLRPHKEATQTPLPPSPACQNQTPRAPDTTHITMATTKEGPTSSTNEDENVNKTETENNQRRVNVGTLSKVEANQVQQASC